MYLSILNPTLLVAAFLITFASSAPSSGQLPSWRQLAPIPLFPRQEQTTVFLPPSTVAILGGVIPSNMSFPPVDTTPLMQFYSIKDNTWTTRASMPRGLNHANAAVVDGKIYVLGGLAETGEPGEGKRVWDAVPGSWVYDPITDLWETVPGIPAGEERGSASVGTYQSQIYLAGGMSELELFENGTQNSVSVVSVFDTDTRTWLSVPEAAKYIPEARDHAGAAVIGSKMYVLGGRDSGQENIRDTVFFLDLCDLEAGWKTSEARMPTPRGGVATGVIGKKVYVFGGEGNAQSETGVFDQVEVYDTMRDRWAKAGKMRLPRHGTYAVGVNGKVYVPGGGVSQSGAPVSDFDVFVP
ncbi:uncharacterized protein ALTATR162_LOCUS9156 [Alternaria atra]|uniref:Galactose oxidase n=1 Tax=Alternaria atra TaxID=119953 RepID=A0A8J2I833_9PLEO|nr:uncharacterized protein ALTATR162_LOCUS9156 [Alternaria atra]CAG5179331.1 unnamed protein product [Alternaria atra]